MKLLSFTITLFLSTNFCADSIVIISYSNISFIASSYTCSFVLLSRLSIMSYKSLYISSVLPVYFDSIGVSVIINIAVFDSYISFMLNTGNVNINKNKYTHI